MRNTNALHVEMLEISESLFDAQSICTIEIDWINKIESNTNNNEWLVPAQFSFNAIESREKPNSQEIFLRYDKLYQWYIIVL